MPVIGLLLLLSTYARADDSCQFLGKKTALPNYESGGPYVLDHFQLNKDRADLRDFLWKHWHNHVAAVAKFEVKTIDAGTPTELVIIEPNAQGVWGINVEIDSRMYPPCVRFHADDLVRVPIGEPSNDYYQTLGYYPNDKLPKSRVPDDAVTEPRNYWIVLVKDGKPASNTI
jgi:hypothetical protein